MLCSCYGKETEQVTCMWGVCVVMGYIIRMSYINYIRILDHRLSELYSLIRTL